MFIIYLYISNIIIPAMYLYIIYIYISLEVGSCVAVLNYFYDSVNSVTFDVFIMLIMIILEGGETNWSSTVTVLWVFFFFCISM